MDLRKILPAMLLGGAAIISRPARAETLAVSNPALAAMRATEQALAARLRAAWLAAGHPQPPAGTEPSLSGGQILTPMLDVAHPPAAPAVSFRYLAPAGLSQIMFTFTSASTTQFLTLDYSPPYTGKPSTEGRATVQHPLSNGFGSTFSNPALGLYAAPGTWTLTSADVFDQSGGLTFYSGAQLATVFAQMSFQVVNRTSPDITAPTVTGGKILTPTISLGASNPLLRVVMQAGDDLSGVASAFVSFNGFGVSASADLPKPTASGPLSLYGVIPAGTAAGTYTISSVSVCDVAGNCLNDSSPSDIAAIFARTTVTIAN